MRLMKNTQGHDEGGVIKPGAKLSGNAVAGATRNRPRAPECVLVRCGTAARSPA
ncbi:hypothetical protein [Nocardia gipuzkoensis]|uniref:hypothetical protein n=1 Tax=Nocardia gipuzkoensis TaxID=2749991 RepID=UPI000B1BB00E|nr:hypothetical protein [Nocardia gipuzkoensis]